MWTPVTCKSGSAALVLYIAGCSHLVTYCCGVQTFIKVANYQHIMPTRYTLDVDLKSIVTQEAVENSSKRTEARKVSVQACVMLHCWHHPAPAVSHCITSFQTQMALPVVCQDSRCYGRQALHLYCHKSRVLLNAFSSRCCWLLASPVGTTV